MPPPAGSRRTRRTGGAALGRLRLATGLVLATFVTGHLLNHSLGVVSIDAQETLRQVLSPIWQSWPGTIALYFALIVHPCLGLYGLWRRRTLRMPAWELAQLVLGLAIPLLLMPHLFATRIASTLMVVDTSYPAVVSGLWSSAQSLVRQPLLVVVVWGHLMIGLNYWLRLRAWYRTAFPLLVAVAILLPTLALLGFVGAAEELRARDELARAVPETVPPERETVEQWKTIAYATYASLLALVLVARVARRKLSERAGVYRILHANGRQITAPLGQTVLEALREAHVPHASVCGGRARCTTCRVRVRPIEGLAAPAALEAQALSRIHAEPDVRLACQLRPSHDVRVTPLLPPHVDASQANVHLEPGRERAVAVMFVDLRESSRLGERRLPYDVFFIVNRFFAEMQAALQATRGFYSTFNGDGFMALYGTKGELGDACRDAMRGAIAIHERLARLNTALAADLREPLRAGVSVHAGDAIVGTMGPPDHPILSALGDTVNVAARLEAETKRHGAMLVVSEACARAAAIDLASFPRHTASVRGRGEPVTYYVVAHPPALARLLEATTENAGAS